jgi:hypothetical protein
MSLNILHILKYKFFAKSKLMYYYQKIFDHQQKIAGFFSDNFNKVLLFW